MEIWQLGVLSLLGIAAGWVNVMAGGGSVLTVPVMVFMGLPGPVANGTNRISIIGQNIMAVWGFFSKGFSDFRLSITLSVCASIGAFFGASVGVELSGMWFNRVLAAVMVVILILMASGGKAKAKAPAGQQGPVRNLAAGHILMVGAGFWGGFIHIGVGFVLMAILHRVMGIDLVRTNMHKVFIALMFSLVALAVFVARVDIAWDVGLALAGGNAIGGYLGARSAMATGEKWIRLVVIVALAVMTVKLVFFP